MFLAMGDLPPVVINHVQQEKVSVKDSTYAFGVCHIEHSNQKDSKITLGDGSVLLEPKQFASFRLLPEKYDDLAPADLPPKVSDELVSHDWQNSFEVKILDKPINGKIVTHDDESKVYSYNPNVDFEGKDELSFLVTGKDWYGAPFEMVIKHYINILSDLEYGNFDRSIQEASIREFDESYRFEPIEGSPEYTRYKEIRENVDRDLLDSTYGELYTHYCGRDAYFWPMTKTDDLVSSSNEFLGNSFFLGKVIINELSGAALGETVNSTVTLDADAAGHGWYTGGFTNLANLNLDANFAQNLSKFKIGVIKDK